VKKRDTLEGVEDPIRPRLALRQLLTKSEHALTLVAGNAEATAAVQEIIDLTRRGLAFRRPGKDQDADE
jgi:hypothetical protein